MASYVVSRRSFLETATGLVVGFTLFDSSIGLLAQSGTPLSNAAGLAPDQLDSWLAIAPDGMVSVFTSKVDLGTGTGTALGQIVAEELDVAMSSIEMVIGDTTRSVDQGRTSASRTLERAGPQMRQAAAAARRQLLRRASTELGAPADRLNVADGVVTVADEPARRISYATLVGGRRFDTPIAASGEQWDLKLAPDVTPKRPGDYKVVGTSVARLDLPDKLTGAFAYAQEIRVPGMLHGRVVRPPVVNSTPTSVDEQSIGGILGIVRVVRQGNFVGVVAETEWAAIRAARSLKVSWSPAPAQLPDGAEAIYEYLQNTKSFSERVGADNGDVVTGLAQAAQRFDSVYRWPFQMHGMIGPSCAVADVQGDKATIWSGSQAPFITRNGVARILGLRDENVHFIYREGSGCFGRLEPDDAPEDAALMSRAVGRPVRVQWMREDEHGWEPKGPPQLITLRSGLDRDGRVTAWDYVERTLPWTDARLSPMLASRQTGIKPDENGFAIGGTDGTPYTFVNRKATALSIPWLMTPNPLRTANLRAPYGQGRCFACESQMDDMAAAAGVDPIAFRLRYVAENTRAVDVLRAVATAANWQPRRSGTARSDGPLARGRGVAISGLAGTLVAQVAEVEVERTTGVVHVRKVTVAHDCGLIVNPDGLRNQIEGNVIQSTSRALMEEVHFNAAGVTSLNWASYPILRFRDVPEVEIVLINRPELPPSGGGEASSIATPAAIANAIFDAIGIRLRQAPFTADRTREKLRNLKS